MCPPTFPIPEARSELALMAGALGGTEEREINLKTSTFIEGGHLAVFRSSVRVMARWRGVGHLCVHFDSMYLFM